MSPNSRSKDSSQTTLNGTHLKNTDMKLHSFAYDCHAMPVPVQKPNVKHSRRGFGEQKQIAGTTGLAHYLCIFGGAGHKSTEYTLPETNIAPENRPSQKESN